MIKRVGIVMMIFIVSMAMIMSPCEAKSKTNLQIAKGYCKKYCRGYTVKVVGYNRVPKVRTNSNVIYIEKIKTKSLGGKTGKTKDGYRVKYIKPVKKNRIETVYCVYNPKTNACDDIICFVSNKKIRADKRMIKPNNHKE